MVVRFSQQALDDLRTIARYIARDNPRAAMTWVAKLRAQAELAAFFPRAGRIVPELGDESVREVFVRTYRIIYEIKGEELVVLYVFEGHYPRALK